MAGLVLLTPCLAQDLTKLWDRKSEVIVFVDDKPAANIDVRLSFENAWESIPDSGRELTKHYRTDANGKAVIKHSGTGQAKVLIQGEWAPHGTTGLAPGTFVARLSTEDPRQSAMLDKWQRLPEQKPAETNAAASPDMAVLIISGDGTATNAPAAPAKPAKTKAKKEKPKTY